LNGSGNNYILYNRGVNVSILNSVIINNKDNAGVATTIDLQIGNGVTIRNNSIQMLNANGLAAINIGTDYTAGGTSGNVICLNNFTTVGNLPYIRDMNGTNAYNCTFDGKNQGNAYANVLNGSVIAKGTVNSSISGLYIGTAGAGVPYTNVSSLGKFACNFAGCQDNAPLTTDNVVDSCTPPVSGNWTLNLADNCNITSSVNLGANWLIYNGTGMVTYNNTTATIVMSAKGEKLTSITGSFYEKILSTIWKNYTG
jgi:hypothetical protein